MNAHVTPPDPKSRPGGFMYVFTGIYWPYDPRVEEVHIEDVAHHLAMQCRYAGAVTDYYSVAEHCYWASYIVPPEDALEALLHDAAEAYVQDFIRPHKIQPWCREPYLEVEARNERVIAERFQLRHPWPKSVKAADEAMANAEMKQIIASGFVNYLVMEGSATADVNIACWSPQQAKLKFMQRFHELKRCD